MRNLPRILPATEGREEEGRGGEGGKGKQRSRRGIRSAALASQKSTLLKPTRDFS